MPSAESPLSGRCACGAVRIRLTAPFESAGFCHCHRCQGRSGVPLTVNGLVAASGFELVSGAEELGTWRPEGGRSKSFCRRCGGHVFSGDPDRDAQIAIRFGALEGDPEIEPSRHAWVSSAPEWYPLPEDGLPRYPESRARG